MFPWKIKIKTFRNIFSVSVYQTMTSNSIIFFSYIKWPMKYDYNIWTYSIISSVFFPLFTAEGFGKRITSENINIKRYFRHYKRNRYNTAIAFLLMLNHSKVVLLMPDIYFHKNKIIFTLHCLLKTFRKGKAQLRTFLYLFVLSWLFVVIL